MEEVAKLTINPDWTLFLDRDGVINRRLVGDYVSSIEDFDILPGVLDFISWAATVFYKIVVVTNQQGIGKQLMTTAQLDHIHQHLLGRVADSGGRIDAIYFAPQLRSEQHPDRKPDAGMALAAKADYPHIDFSRSIMVGDSPSDIEFGRRLGMKTCFVRTPEVDAHPAADLYLTSLAQLREKLIIRSQT